MGFAVLALLGAASWGVGDFFGGVAARRAHVLTVLVVSQAVGLAGAAIWVLASADPLPAAADLLPALGAGLCGAVGLAALYRGMAVGAMGIVAPISAASPVVPLLVDLGRGVRPAALQWLGIAVVLAGIVLLAREPGGAGGSSRLATGVTLALVAALAFGLFVVGLDAAADASVPWTIVAVRTVDVPRARARTRGAGHAPPPRPAPSADRGGWSLRHCGQRARRVCGDARLGRSRRRAGRALPRHDDPPRAPRPRRARRIVVTG